MIQTLRLHYTRIAAGALLALGLAGCAKNEDNTPTIGTMIIKGRLLADCSGAPLKGLKLRCLLFQLYNRGPKDGLTWYATTDSTGNFSFSVSSINTTNLVIRKDEDDDTSFYFTYPGKLPLQNGNVVDLGTIYRRLSLSYAVAFRRSGTQANDTLFYGNADSLYGTAVGAAIDGHSYYFRDTTAGRFLPYSTQRYLVWGIGAVDYRRALDSFTKAGPHPDPNFDRLITLRPGICSDDTVRVRL